MNRPLYNNNERTETVDEMVNNILTELINKVVDGIDHEKDVILDELPIGGKFLRMPAQLQYLQSGKYVNLLLPFLDKKS